MQYVDYVICQNSPWTFQNTSISIFYLVCIIIYNCFGSAVHSRVQMADKSYIQQLRCWQISKSKCFAFTCPMWVQHIHTPGEIFASLTIRRKKISLNHKEDFTKHTFHEKCHNDDSISLLFTDIAFEKLSYFRIINQKKIENLPLA